MRRRNLLAGICSFAILGTSAAIAGPVLVTPVLTTLVSFTANTGAQPTSGLIADAAGNLYGTTSMYGYVGGGYFGGTAYQIAAGTNALTTLANFTGTNGQDAYGGLLFDASHNLYGTTYAGGANNDGVVYKIAAGTNTLSTLVTFSGSNGANPFVGLTVDPLGNIYGTTVAGGTSGDGTVFKLAAGTNAFSTVATFNGGNGQGPASTLLIDSARNLYGTAQFGGANGDGTVFKIAAGSSTISTLATFSGTNGSGPSGTLIEDAKGNLYGTTTAGGSSGYGTVFKIAAGTNSLTTLATFTGTNGVQPGAGLILDNAGDLFGTTTQGGTGNYGTVFEIAAGTNTLTTLVNFNNLDGKSPEASLIADASGDLFGTTEGGGASFSGTAFEITGAGFVVPEPGSATLITLCGIALLRRRHSRVS